MERKETINTENILSVIQEKPNYEILKTIKIKSSASSNFLLGKFGLNYTEIEQKLNTLKDNGLVELDRLIGFERYYLTDFGEEILNDSNIKEIVYK